MRETITHSEEIFDGRIVHLKVHDVELANGSKSKREVIHHMGAVAVVATNDMNQVLMVKQFRLPTGKAIWEIPAGTLEPDEDPETCARRELQEETGYKPIDLVSLGGIHPAPGYTTEFIHIYWSKHQEESKLPADEDEFVESEWKSFDDLLDMVESGELTDSKTVVGLLRVARELKI